VPRFAANLSTLFQEWPFLDRFAAAADAGFQAVECQFPYAVPADAVAARLARQGLCLVMFNFPPGDWAAGDRGLATAPERYPELQAAVDLGLAYAAATGAGKMHLLAGNAKRDAPRALHAYRRALDWTAERAAAQDLEILIEPINAGDQPGYFLSDFAAAEELIKALALPNLKLQFDIYHRQRMHGDVMEALQRLLPVIGHIQVAGVPGRHEPNSGELNDTRIFRELDRLGYASFVGCEYTPARDTLSGLHWMHEWTGAAD
jgi:hydroxypyruvate isomerase